MGKFVIKAVPSGVKFDLKAANGEVISTSEVYTTKAACLKGVESVKKNASAANVEDQTEEGFKKAKHPKFEVYMDKDDQFRFRLKATNGQVIASCGEGYTTKAACLGGVESVKKNAVDSEITEV